MRLLKTGDRIAVNVHLLSGWIGCGTVIEDQDDGDDVIVFAKDDDQVRAMAIRSQVSIIGEECAPTVNYRDSRLNRE